jgi:hypothetical protein
MTGNTQSSPTGGKRHVDAAGTVVIEVLVAATHSLIISELLGERRVRVSSLLLAACLASTAVHVSASEFNGTIKGSVDGRSIDVKAACFADKQPWDWLRALSDPTHRPESLRDLDGDGLAIVASTSRSMGGATITMKAGEASYKFHGGKRITTFDDSGFRIVGKIDRTEGKGKDRKVVGSYQVDLTIACSGI